MLEAEGLNFSVRFINDSGVRKQYLRNIKAVSEEYIWRVNAGSLSAKTAAQEVNLIRNQIMEASRLKLSDVSLAYSISKKETGKTLAELLEIYASEKFKLPFDQLNISQQNNVYLEIVQSGGRARAKVNVLARNLSRLGRGLIFVTMAISVYNIADSEDKLRTTAKEGAILGGGILGGAAGGAAAGLVCGPGAPVCVTIGVFVGGALGAFGADLTFDWLF